MATAQRFDYDGTGIDRVYETGRTFSDGAGAVWRQRLTRELADVRPARIADVGCGTGRFTRLLAELAPRAAVCGIDASWEMLQAGRAAGPALPLARGAAEALPLRAGAVDFVLLAFVFHHLADRAAALAECTRVLRPGGTLLVIAPTLENLPTYRWMEFFPSARAIDEARLPARAQVQALAEAAGLVARAAGPVATPVTPDPVAYAERIAKRAVSSLRLVPDAEFETGIAALRRHGAAHRDDGPVWEEVDCFSLGRPA